MPRYAGLACGARGPWCLVSDVEGRAVCLADLRTHAVEVVAEGLEARGVVVIRNDSTALVSSREGLSRIALDGSGARDLVLSRWPFADAFPRALAADERGSFVRGRDAGTAVIYAVDEATESVFSVDVSAANAVIDARVAVLKDATTRRPRDVAFDAARGEVVLAAAKGLVVSNSRILGAATAVARVAMPGRIAAVEWLGDAHGAQLEGREETDALVAAFRDASTGDFAVSNGRDLFRMQVPSARAEPALFHDSGLVANATVLSRASGPCDVVGLSDADVLECFRVDGRALFLVDLLRLPDNGCATTPAPTTAAQNYPSPDPTAATLFEGAEKSLPPPTSSRRTSSTFFALFAAAATVLLLGRCAWLALARLFGRRRRRRPQLIPDGGYRVVDQLDDDDDDDEVHRVAGGGGPPPPPPPRPEKPTTTTAFALLSGKKHREDDGLGSYEIVAPHEAEDEVLVFAPPS